MEKKDRKSKMVRIDKGLIKKVNLIVANGEAANFSDFVNDAIQEKIKEAVK